MESENLKELDNEEIRQDGYSKEEEERYLWMLEHTYTKFIGKYNENSTI